MDTTVSSIPLPDNYTWLILGCLIFPISCFYLLRTTFDGKLYDMGGLPILSVWSFFSKRYDFMRENLKLSRGLPFRFRILQYRVVGVSGPSGRKLFFNHSSLDMSEGYKILMGAAPRLEDMRDSLETSERLRAEGMKRIHFILQKDRMVEILPLLLGDLNHTMLKWGREGIINPFEQVYDLVFQITLRLTTCADLCRDEEAKKKIASHYWSLEQSSTATALLLPWFPSPAKRMNKRATRDLFNVIVKFVQARRAAGAPTKDTIDALIQKGEKDIDIVTVVVGTLFAGIVTTGITSCWILLYLGTHNEWRQRVISEIKSMMSTHSDTIGVDSFHKQLATIPLPAWEDELPTLDLVIRETIRLSSSATFLRRNLKADIDVDGVRIAKGDFMAYLATDVHMDEKIYPDPFKFDPGRYEEGRNEDKSAYFGYLGWGVGRHPCAGMRVAKLEMKILVTMMLLGFDLTVVDKQGNPTNEIPGPDRNDILQARPKGKLAYLKFKRVRD